MMQKKLSSIKRVSRIYLKDSVPVYDISVSKNENFCLASGCVVHNSKDISDAVAGSLYSAKIHMAEFRANTTSAELISALTSQTKPSNAYEDILGYKI